MAIPPKSQTGPPSILEHDLQQYFPELLKFESTREMLGSEFYIKIRLEVERILNAVVVWEPPAVASGKNEIVQPASTASGSERISALAWNIERGIQLDGIIDALKNHRKLKDKDLFLLTELDYGMARSGNRFVAQEIAEALNLQYAFAPFHNRAR